jgi:hypothetical protein
MSSVVFVDTKNTLDTILESILNKQGGMYLRFGDGDYKLAMGQDDMLAKSTNSLQKWMIRAMQLDDKSIMLCLPHHCKELNTLEKGMCGGNHEYIFDVHVTHFLNILKHLRQGNLPNKLYTNVALSYNSYHNPARVIEVHRALQKNCIVFWGNSSYPDDFIKKLFGSDTFRINTPVRDSFFKHDEVFAEFDTLYKTNLATKEYFIIVMAAGCAGRAFSAELYDTYYVQKQNFFVFDYGSLIDYLSGYKSRAYMDIEPPNSEYILSNM